MKKWIVVIVSIVTFLMLVVLVKHYEMDISLALFGSYSSEPNFQFYDGKFCYKAKCSGNENCIYTWECLGW